jgi:hypothetical protein
MSMGRSLVFLLFAASAYAQSSVTSLTAYSGNWRVVRKGVDPSAKPERLQNNCATIGTYYACQQTINGTIGGVLIFIPSGGSGHFITQNVAPSGRATGTGELNIEAGAAARWIFLSSWNNGTKTIRYRTIDVFTTKNKIEFQQEESEDNGKSWRTTGSGEYIREGSAAK